ncbi:MAG: hypothetical protein IKI91_05535 [Clostridia bacterium]|nr:hypothetical protein [Clostridia bacterium]
MKSSEEMMNSLLERRRVYNENKGVTGKRGVRRPAMKRVLIVAAVVAVVASVVVIAGEIHHDKTITTPDGKTVELDYSGTEDMLNGDNVDKYTDQSGNTYLFNKDDLNTSYATSLEKYKENYYRYQNGEYETVEEKTAVETASAELSSRYGKYFDSMQLINTTYAEGDGIWYVTFAQLIGEDDIIEGITCNASVLPDGTIESSALVGVPEFEGIGDEQVKGITFERIVNDIEQAFNERYGDTLVSYEIDRIWLKNDDGRVCVAVSATPEISMDDGSTRTEELPLFTYEING